MTWKIRPRVRREPNEATETTDPRRWAAVALALSVTSCLFVLTALRSSPASPTPPTSVEDALRRADDAAWRAQDAAHRADDAAWRAENAARLSSTPLAGGAPPAETARYTMSARSVSSQTNVPRRAPDTLVFPQYFDRGLPISDDPDGDPHTMDDCLVELTLTAVGGIDGFSGPDDFCLPRLQPLASEMRDVLSPDVAYDYSAIIGGTLTKGRFKVPENLAPPLPLVRTLVVRRPTPWPRVWADSIRVEWDAVPDARSYELLACDASVTRCQSLSRGLTRVPAFDVPAGGPVGRSTADSFRLVVRAFSMDRIGTWPADLPDRALRASVTSSELLRWSDHPNFPWFALPNFERNLVCDADCDAPPR